MKKQRQNTQKKNWQEVQGKIADVPLHTRPLTIEHARYLGKLDEWMKLAGGFVIAILADGLPEYYPFGKVPHDEKGRVLPSIRIIEQWKWSGNGKSWRKLKAYTGEL